MVNIIVTIASVLTAIGVITTTIVKVVDKAFSKVNNDIRGVDILLCRVYLIAFLCDLERGEEKDEVQWKLAHDFYDHYTNDLKQNSYVHDKWNRVMKEVEK